MRPAALLLLLSIPQEERIVFLGDSITDGHTLPLLVAQASGAACINAGVAGDTAEGMRKRLERDVLPRRPGRVVLLAGINDVLRGVPPLDYETDVTAISDRLKRERIPMILVTPTILGPKHADREPRLGSYIDVLRRLASREGYAIAEGHDRLKEARSRGDAMLEPDQVHLTFAAYRVLARAVLDALGRPDAPVPEAMALEPMAGIVPEWKIRAAAGGVAKTLTLPQRGPAAHWWFDQERRRGFAVELDKVVGPAAPFVATATVESATARDVFVNTGADLAEVSLNGKLLWKSRGWTGWHAGKERIAARLAPGANMIEIRSGASFFLSITDGNSW